MPTPHYQIADLFCGAGGTSTGAVEAVEALGYRPRLTAVNHWPVAVATHELNHPGARHRCASLDSLNPRELFRPGELKLLWASPECTHHSVARGGTPINDQSRATAWCVTRWAEALLPEIVCVENVPEFATWGPIGTRGRPLKRGKGKTFEAWLNTLRALGYRVDHRVLVAADYGDPTTRRRLFIQAVRGNRSIVWPTATHAEKPSAGQQRWVAAREVIDWTLEGKSIYERERPLSPNTLRRIWTGLAKFGLDKSFLVAMEHGGRVRDLDRPMPTITTAKGGAIGLTKPFLVKLRGTGTVADLDNPAPTITSGGNHLALAEPGLLPQHAGGALRPVSQPTPTVTTDGAIALVEPFLIQYYGTGHADSVDAPLASVTTKGRHGLVQPVVEVEGERYLLDVRFRMLQPHELAQAQGFRRDYQFTGTKTEQVKQIGNAVPRHLARAIVAAAVSQRADVSGLVAPEL